MGASDPVGLPEAEPRIVGIGLVVLAIRGHAVAGTNRSAVRQQVELLQLFNLLNDLLDIHLRYRAV